MVPLTPAQQQRLLGLIARAMDRQQMRFDRTLNRAHLDEHDRLVDAYLTLADAAVTRWVDGLLVDDGGR